MEVTTMSDSDKGTRFVAMSVNHNVNQEER